MSSFFNKFSAPIFALLVLFAWFFFKQKETVTDLSAKTLIVGLESGYPPFEFTNSKGELVGFDLDIAQKIAEKMGKQLVVKDMEFEGELLSLKQGKIDLIISGMNITPSKTKEIAMVPYHGETTSTFSLIFWKQIPDGVRSLEDIASLPNPKVSAELGANPEALLLKYKGIEVISLQGVLPPLLDVMYGKSSANLVENEVAGYFKKLHPEIKILSVPLSEAEKIQGYGIGIKKENKELIAQVQQIIQELKDSGEMSELETKWFAGGAP